MTLEEKLFSLRDEKYRAFHLSLCPGLSPERVIGVRAPQLRALAKELIKSGQAESFLESLPHPYYEMDNIHAFILSDMKDYGRCVGELERFLPHVDNWATCDSIRPRCFKSRPEGLTAQIRLWLSSEHCYTVRFGMEMLMVYYLDESFRPEYPDWVLSVRREDYYIKMMQAWYVAEGLAKQWDEVIGYITGGMMPLWVHNKAIQKAVESRRISEDRKAYLKSLRRKDSL